MKEENQDGTTPVVHQNTQHREIQKRQPCVLQDIPTGQYFVGIVRGTVTWTDDIEKAVVHPKKGWMVTERERLIPVKVIPVPLWPEGRGEPCEPQHKSPVTTKLPPVQQGGDNAR